MVYAAIKFISQVFATLPEGAVQFICALIGDLIYLIPNKRRTTTLSNLSHAYPDRSEKWRRSIARESLRRMVEMFLFSVAVGSFKADRINRIVEVPEVAKKLLHHYLKESGGILLLHHFTLFESTTLLPTVDPILPPFAALYRPLDLKGADRWVRESRARFGGTLFSRHDGLIKATRFIRKGGGLVILYDQNAGDTGALITAFDRVASATDLPGIFASRLKVPVLILTYPRTGFWRGRLHVEPILCEQNPKAITITAQAWLESYLNHSDDNCADWLWCHERWRTQDRPQLRLRLEHKTNYLEAEHIHYGRDHLPRKTRIWIRMPNWLGDIMMAIPLIRTIRTSRPDAEITLLLQKNFVPLLEHFGIADHLMALPEKDSPGYFFKLLQWRRSYPDTHILLTHSFRGDLEARLIGCSQRFGMVLPGKWRPLLTHHWRVAPNLSLRDTHQTELWLQFLQSFGLEGAPLTEPLALKETGDNPEERQNIGMICGTENNPEKRWSIGNWRSLIEQTSALLSDGRIILFGTDRDKAITTRVAEGFPHDKVEDRAGRTHLLEFAKQIQTCQLVVSNDTGGMHLANALGIPVIAIFGPTNPVRTGPVFSSRVSIVQPAGCSPTGGEPMDKITTETVMAAIQAIME